MPKRGAPTAYPGVKIIGPGVYVVRLRARDRRTQRLKELQRQVHARSAQEAAEMRARLFAETTTGRPTRLRVGEYAQSWIASKALKIDRSTAWTYARALDQHILPALGDFFYDELTSRDVQRWIDDAIRRGWTAKAKGRKTGVSGLVRRQYTRSALAVWLRTLRTMSRDAMAELDLPRDPTIRVALPMEVGEAEQTHALSAAELARFLDAFRTKHPSHYAFVATLAFTGLRFCHASALRWEDWDEVNGVLRVIRKQVCGQVGPVSRRKRAPREYPVEPTLTAILRAHREALLPSAVDGPVEGWMFPSRSGTLRTPNSMDRAWAKALAAAGINRRFTVHGLRYTFTDLIRRANVDAVVRRAMTGHVTVEMQRHYSSVGLDEKRAAMAGVFSLLASTNSPTEDISKRAPVATRIGRWGRSRHPATRQTPRCASK